MSDLQSFSRQWLILQKLTARGPGKTLQELASEFDVNEKTIRRDLDALRSVGFHLKDNTGSHGQKYWRIDSDHLLSGLTFTFDEVAALYLGRRFLDPLANTSLWDAAQRAFRKIHSGLGDERSAYLEKLTTAFHQTAVGRSDYAQRADVIDSLMFCIEQKYPASITYHSVKRGTDKTTTVHPYGLVYHRTALYLVAYAPEHNEVRHYKIDRISNADACQEESFERPEDFDLQSHLQDTFGVFYSDQPPSQVRIRFSPHVASYVQEHRWHDSQTVEPLDEDWVLVSMELSSLEEVKAWVLSFGVHAIVEEPTELRDLVREQIEQMQQHYVSPPEVH